MKSDTPAAEPIIIGSDTHSLGKRTFAPQADGSVEMVSEAFGMREVKRFTAAEAETTLAEIRATYANYDATPEE